MNTERQDKAQKYRNTLIGLKDYQKRLGLEEEFPSERIFVSLGLQSKGRPVGSILPVYPKKDCTINEKGFGKILFNLKSLLDVEPQKK